MKLTRWDTEETIHETKHVTIKECVEDAIKKSVNLFRVDLIGANLAGANMTGADMTGADLRHVNMAGADLRCADLRHSNMTGADLDFSSWPLWRGSCEVKLDKKNNERFAYYCMVNMSAEVLADFLQNPVEFANRFAERKGISKIKAGEK